MCCMFKLPYANQIALSNASQQKFVTLRHFPQYFDCLYNVEQFIVSLNIDVSIKHIHTFLKKNFIFSKFKTVPTRSTLYKYIYIYTYICILCNNIRPRGRTATSVSAMLKSFTETKTNKIREEEIFAGKNNIRLNHTKRYVTPYMNIFFLIPITMTLSAMSMVIDEAEHNISIYCGRTQHTNIMRKLL